MENNIKIDGFNFGDLKDQDLNICSSNDICFNCENLLAKFAKGRENEDCNVIVSSILPYKHPTCLKDHHFPQHDSPNFIKIGFADNTNSEEDLTD
jgi:hypothetical protein